jgi:hypothetical protein
LCGIATVYLDSEREHALVRKKIMAGFGKEANRIVPGLLQPFFGYETSSGMPGVRPFEGAL